MARKKVYIAGPMRGIPYYNFPAFDKAAAGLRDAGYDAVSPADIDRLNGFDPQLLPEDHDWNTVPAECGGLLDVIRRDVNGLLECDCIYLLPGWEKSTGALAEYALARWNGCKVFWNELAKSPESVFGDYKAPDTTKESNPKDVIGSTKPPMHYLPAGPMFECAAALMSGALKYGAHNWRAVGVRASVYYDAMWRHIAAWWEGEDRDPESGMPHLAHAMACLVILRDSDAAGKLTDDRPIVTGNPYAALADPIKKLATECKIPVKPFTQKAL